jgi:hypothetical protein
MNVLTATEQRMVENLYDPELQAVLNDIKGCNYRDLRDQFKKEHAIVMEQVLGLEMPPPKKPWETRMRPHYSKMELWNRMCEMMEAMPVLRSTNIDRLMTKFHLASQVPLPIAE